MSAVCEVCGVNTAQNYLCEIIDGKETRLDLCDSCLAERRAALGMVAPPDLRTERCYYCGAPAQSCSKNLEWEEAARGQLFHCRCFRCGQLYFQLSTAALKLDPTLSPSEKHEALVRAIVDSDQKVREAVQT